MKKKLIKTACALIAFSLLLKILTAECTAQVSRSWYIKRNGNNTPTFPHDSEVLDSCDCYYLDKKAAECGERVLYLTFDAGYENGNIEKILDTMKHEEVTGTFFILDNLIYKNADLLIRMEREGHTVANHTATHKNLSQSSEEEIKRELTELEELYTEKTGYKMSKYFRFPEGKYSLEAVKEVSALGYKTIFWSFGYEDWDNARQPDCEYAKRKILSNTHPGAVILLHPTSETNARILPQLIKEWKAMGYRFGTLNELCK